MSRPAGPTSPVPVTARRRRCSSRRCSRTKQFKRLGLIYNTNELNARLNAAQVRKTAGDMGLDLIEVNLPLRAKTVSRRRMR